LTIAYVCWRDAVQEGADGPEAPVHENPLVTLEEIGWLVGESEESISLSMEHEPESDTWGRWRLHIPKVNIISLRVLEFDKFPKKRRRVL